MQVGDAPPPGTVANGLKEELSADAADAAPSTKRPTQASSGKFRAALKAGEGGMTDAGACALAAGLTARPWFRPEGAPAASTPGPTGAARSIDRVLIGSRGEVAEARIRIGGGMLAGSEIRLSALSGSPGVQAQLLTGAEGSRQTLSVMIEEIRLRLRGRGIVLSMSGPDRSSTPLTPQSGGLAAAPGARRGKGGGRT